MPEVHTYWQMPADEEDFLDFLNTTNRMLALPGQWVRAKAELLPQPIATFLRDRDPAQLWFGPERFALEAEAGVEEHVKGGETYFGLPYFKLCLISYSPGRLDPANKLGQSNLAVDWEYPDKGRMTPKNADFIKWGKRVFSWIRKQCPERLLVNGFAYPATTRVKEAVEREGIQLVLY